MEEADGLVGGEEVGGRVEESVSETGFGKYVGNGEFNYTRFYNDQLETLNDTLTNLLKISLDTSSLQKEIRTTIMSLEGMQSSKILPAFLVYQPILDEADELLKELGTAESLDNTLWKVEPSYQLERSWRPLTKEVQGKRGASWFNSIAQATPLGAQDIRKFSFGDTTPLTDKDLLNEDYARKVTTELPTDLGLSTSRG
ncbi:MAG: hypothetical protein AAFQ98_27235, partial [Bacteroidota bacterium]